MERHVLLAVTDERCAQYGPRFCGSFFRNKASARCTLVSVAPDPEARLSMAGGHADILETDTQRRKAKALADKALETSTRLLLEDGFAPDQVRRLFIFSKAGVAWDILQEGLRGRYDAIVLGRRGLSRAEEMIVGSVSLSLTTLAPPAPLWLCHTPSPGALGALVCADGSDASLRAADHVGFILAEEPEHPIRVFHVWDPSRHDALEAEEIVLQAKAALLANGVDEARVTTRIRRGSGAARLIWEEMEEGKYAALAIGRTGADRGFFGKLLAGSTSLALLHKHRGGSLWIVH